LEGKIIHFIFLFFLNQYFSTIVDVCLTIIRNNQFSSRARTVKDYLSFILAVAIGQFRIEEGKTIRMDFKIIK
jgi:hypothetical protein